MSVWDGSVCARLKLGNALSDGYGCTVGCDSVSNTPCYASLAAFDLLSCGVGEILGENVA